MFTPNSVVTLWGASIEIDPVFEIVQFVLGVKYRAKILGHPYYIYPLGLLSRAQIATTVCNVQACAINDEIVFVSVTLGGITMRLAQI